jgi:hypothetical protein
VINPHAPFSKVANASLTEVIVERIAYHATLDPVGCKAFGAAKIKLALDAAGDIVSLSRASAVHRRRAAGAKVVLRAAIRNARGLRTAGAAGRQALFCVLGRSAARGLRERYAIRRESCPRDGDLNCTLRRPACFVAGYELWCSDGAARIPTCDVLITKIAQEKFVSGD